MSYVDFCGNPVKLGQWYLVPTIVGRSRASLFFLKPIDRRPSSGTLKVEKLEENYWKHVKMWSTSASGSFRKYATEKWYPISADDVFNITGWDVD